MNLIARCPACQTSYRVVPDQLRVSDGWVRCGECGEVFDAAQQLFDAESGSSATEAPVLVDDGVQAHPVPPGVNQQDSSLSTTDDPAHHESLTDPFAAEGSWASATLLIKPSSESESESDAEEPAATTSAPLAAPVSFMLAPDGSSSARQERKAVMWWGLGGLLLVGLLLQGVYRERDQLSASFPVMKPVLIAACEFLACRIAPVHAIESLAIDTATFQQVGSDAFELRFVVKNKSRFELALPAIELTLTDLADQPVMRRVFTPAELGVATATVASAGEWSVTTYLHLRAQATDARAQGYRLLIFYP
jgi:predicted Zn finger-like uncharacterized protein